MPTFPISSSASHLLLPSSSSSSFFFFTKTIILKLNPNPNHYKQLFLFNSSETTLTYQSKLLFSVVTSSNNSTSNFDLPPPPSEDEDKDDNNDEEDTGILDSEETQSQSVSSESENGVDIQIEKIGNNSRRIRSRISIDASLETVWGLLTDYEGLSDFIPGLSVSQLLEKGHNFARIFQVGQQNLAFGVNFNAKGIVDCYEKDLEILPFGRRRDIDFKMVEGDFQTFQGKWSIEETCTDVDQIYGGGECHTTTTTTLSYIVDVKPKLWLPVGLVEGRLCREVSLNLLCIREEAQKTVKHTLSTC